MISQVLTGLLRAEVAGSLAVVAVMLARGPVRRLFGAQAAYASWVAVALAAAATGLPQRALAGLAPPIVMQASAAAMRAAPTAIQATPGLLTQIAGVWAAGALAAAALLAWRQARFMASLGRLSPGAEPGLLRAERNGVGPAVVGALRPRIVTPADFETRFAPDEREVMLAHERAHLARGDWAVNALAAAVLVGSWFNPLAWMAWRRLRIDQELACDTVVIAQLPAARRLYAELLLKTQIAGQALPLGCQWPAAGEHPLKARVRMLQAPLPGRRRRAAGLAVVAGLSLGLAYAAWGATAAPALVTRPVWITKPRAADLPQYYPKQALAEGVNGSAVLSCRFAADGTLSACRVLREGPAGRGFGEMAMKLTPLFRARPLSGDGKPVAGVKVNIPFRFIIPRAKTS